MSAADETFRMLAGIIEATRLVPQALRAPPGSLPLTVLGGFLGAGKTTLVNRLLAGAHGVRIAVLVNDFGAINVDAALVRSRTEDTIALTNGCACCTVAGDLTRALVDLAQREDAPDAIVLEASGVADPRTLAQVALANPSLRLDGLVTLVDAQTAVVHASDPRYGALFQAQVDAADLVVLNKCDLASSAELEAARAWVAGRAHGGAVLEAVHAEVPTELLLGIDSTRPLDERPRDADHRSAFASRLVESDKPLDAQGLARMIDAGGAGVLRAKGIVWLASDPACRTLFQRVGTRCTFTPAGPWNGERPRSQVVVIAKA